jgi:hypothetical protein
VNLNQAREELNKLGKEIEIAQREKAQLEGNIQQLKAQLKAEFDLKDEVAAKKYLDELEQNIKEDEAKFKRLIQKTIQFLERTI